MSLFMTTTYDSHLNYEKKKILKFSFSLMNMILTINPCQQMSLPIVDMSI